ncbi:hypothetical protein ACFQWF_12245 [Methylorubrum suomiense]
MVATLEAELGVEVARKTPTYVEVSDPKRLMLWSLWKARGAQPSAYICRKIVQEDGQVKIEMFAECHGQTAQCDGVVGRLLAEQNRRTAPFRP